jgi:uncharacterized damage-inducible protein DinB
MPHTLQEFAADAARRAAKDLLDAALLLPDDRRGWQPLGKGRSALDQLAECAMINGGTVEIIQSHQFPVTDMEAWMQAKTNLAEHWEQCAALLQSSAAQAAEAILTVTDDQLPLEIVMPAQGGPFSLAQIIFYPYWNMTYHQGQITYIGSLT